MKEYPSRHKAIVALKEVGTEEARETLLEIAFGQHGPESTEWAARNYVKSLEDKSRARRLLQADDSRIQHIGLLALRGETIDAALLQDLKQMLKADDFHLRRAAASTVYEAPLHPYGKEIAIALIDSARTVKSLPKADERIAIGMKWTTAGYTCGEIIRALSQSKNINTKLLREFIPTESGNAQACVVIAMAWLGDSSVKPQLREIAKKTELPPLLRSQAIAAFSVIGTKRDIDLLKDIATTDPFKVKPTAQEVEFRRARGQPMVDKVYFIREQAEDMIGQIERKTTER
jgi:HEAT repeat protein